MAVVNDPVSTRGRTGISERRALPRWVRPANFGGVLVGLLFLSVSMTPTLIPRHWVFQAVVSGIVGAAGYGVGTLISVLWRRLPTPEPPPRVKRAAWWALTGAGPVTVVVITALSVRWQADLRRLMGMRVTSGWGQFGALVAGLLLAVALVAIARALRWAARRLSRPLGRWVTARLARPLAAVLVAVIVVGFLDGVVAEAFFSSADQTFRTSDRLVSDDMTPPTTMLRSGSPVSRVRWEDLGSQGRAFVTDGPTRQELAAFGAASTTAPIRVSAGLASARAVHERAALVVDELERTGAFDRAVLCVMTATGTGWIDPAAASALEYMWGGDTALATMQYSYLPSWLSFLVDSGRARQAGAELFNAVYEHWAALPEDERPLLLVFGESLGADGSESAFSGVADLRHRVDGALWVGAPRFSALRATFTERRDPGTPARLPVYDGGATVRFAAQPRHLHRPDTPWSPPRVIYLQHASDPIAWWSPQLILRRPDWLEEPRGDDVLPSVRWYPVVTFWQLTADMANSLNVPPGHGHDYGTLVADAWAAIATPPQWTDDDTPRLRAVLDTEGAATTD